VINLGSEPMVLLKKSETTEQPKAIKSLLEHLTRTVYCETDTLKLCVCAILAGGHILIEDVPGVGKTTLANSLAILLGLDFQRIQFTSDLLPTDITGISIYNPDTKKFEFIAGPVFTSVLLADEINRANPRAQSALLEAMEENSVSVDGKTMLLPQPFYLLATQNPTEQSGTFPLPESQLDRFLLRVSLGYPSASLERDLLTAGDRRKVAQDIGAVCTPETLSSMISSAAEVHCSASLIDYMQRLLKATREGPSNHQWSVTSSRSTVARGCKSGSLYGGSQNDTSRRYSMVGPSSNCSPPQNARWRHCSRGRQSYY